MDIIIEDGNNTYIGERINASFDTISKYIDKGFIIKEQETGNIVTKETLTNTMGVSDGTVIM